MSLEILTQIKAHFNTLKQVLYVHYVYSSSPYRAVNALRLCYTNQSVNVV